MVILDSIPNSLAYMAHLTKQRIVNCLQNALRWLHFNDDDRCSTVRWLV
jgi:hypothetical protein